MLLTVWTHKTDNSRANCVSEKPISVRASSNSMLPHRMPYTISVFFYCFGRWNAQLFIHRHNFSCFCSCSACIHELHIASLVYILWISEFVSLIVFVLLLLVQLFYFFQQQNNNEIRKQITRAEEKSKWKTTNQFATSSENQSHCRSRALFSDFSFLRLLSVDRWPQRRM